MRLARWLVGILAAVGTLGGQELTKLTPELAGQAVGQVVTICGDVAGYDCHAGKSYTLVFRTASAGPAFEVMIDPFDPAASERSLAGRYFGQHVCATGTVATIPSGHRIRVDKADQLQIDPPATETAAVSEGVLWCPSPSELPRIVREVKPQYTAKAMRAGVQGTVQLTAIVEADGSIGRAEVLRSLDPGLDEEALKAVRQWEFEPGTREGTPVPAVVGIELTFTLGKKR